MIHENYPKSLQNRKLILKQKIGHAQNINNMLCYGELFQTEIYQHQYWDLLEFAGIGCLEAHKLASLDKNGIDEISYTSLMTSITTRGTNKKMLINPEVINSLDKVNKLLKNNKENNLLENSLFKIQEEMVYDLDNENYELDDRSTRSMSTVNKKKENVRKLI